MLDFRLDLNETLIFNKTTKNKIQSLIFLKVFLSTAHESDNFGILLIGWCCRLALFLAVANKFLSFLMGLFCKVSGIYLFIFCLHLSLIDLSNQELNVMRYPFKEWSYVSNPKYVSKFLYLYYSRKQKNSQISNFKIRKLNSKSSSLHASRALHVNRYQME